MLTKEAKKFFEREGRKGGIEVYKKHGLKHYKKMAALSAAVRKKKKLSPENA